MKINVNKLDIALASACLSVNELSKRSSVNIVTLTRIRKCTQNPTPKTVGKIAKALNISVEDLIEN